MPEPIEPADDALVAEMKRLSRTPFGIIDLHKATDFIFSARPDILRLTARIEADAKIIELARLIVEKKMDAVAWPLCKPHLDALIAALKENP